MKNRIYYLQLVLITINRQEFCLLHNPKRIKELLRQNLDKVV